MGIIGAASQERHMEPLRIRCRPHGLFWYEYFMPLDSLVQRSVMLERHGRDYYALPTITPSTPLGDLETPVIPIERRQRGQVWYYAASWANVKGVALENYVSAWVRQYPEKEALHYGRHTGKGQLIIKTWQGPDKLYNMPVHALVVDELVWYAVGDGDEIARLLETYYHAIGKKSAYGYGQLCEYDDGRKWQVEAWPEDWSERDGSGALTRGVPPEIKPGGAFSPMDMRRYAVRPPYHVQANYALLEMPPV